MLVGCDRGLWTVAALVETEIVFRLMVVVVEQRK